MVTAASSSASPAADAAWGRFAPAALRRALSQASPGDAAGVQDGSFEAAVLLADISGYSALAARLAERGAGGAEVLSLQLNASFAVILREVHAHGGEVERFAGDALLATFRPGRDGLAGAVVRTRDCALAILARLASADAADVTLGVHAGVAAGMLNTRHVPLPGGDRAFVLSGQTLVDVAAAAAAAGLGEVRLAATAARLAATVDVAVAVAPAADVRVDHGALAPYINRALRDRLGLTADANWLAELRRVTAVFVMPDAPDADAAALARVGQVLGRAVQRYEGLLHELGVDDKGLVAVLLFGLRQTHEDQGERALRTAFDVHGQLAAVGMRAAVGVASGRVYCGVVGDAQRSELAVVGDPMNLAARLMQAAGDGVLCDPATAAEASALSAFSFMPQPGLVLKGMPAGLLAQRPRPRGGATEHPTAHPTPAPLGRDAEWQTVLEVLHTLPALRPSRDGAGAGAASGSVGALLIQGDAGIGKSALLSAAVDEASRLGAVLLHVHGQSLEQVSPYHAWRGAVAQLLGVDLLADRASQLARLQMALATDAEAAGLAPLLSAVLPHAPAGSAAVDVLDAQARAERLRELLLSLVARAAAALPLVLVVEDAHWLDSGSWALLKAAATRRLPMVVLASSRPLESEGRSSLSAWLDLANARVLDLGSMPRPAAAELMRRKLGVPALSDGAEALVYGRAAGHPFFTEELVLALRDAGVLRVAGGLCSLAPSGDRSGDQVVPETLARALTVRIDATSEAQRLALKVASVLGRDFELVDLQAVYPLQEERPRLQQHVQALVTHELLQAPQPGHFRFKHAITRDVAYGLLPFALRRDLHRSLAERLEAQAGPGHDTRSLGLLAHHWSSAEVPDKALAASEAAGMQALERFANREAVHFLRQALRWNDALGQPSAAARTARWHSALGLAQRLLGELGASRQDLQAALRKLGAVVPAKTVAARARMAWALLQFAVTRPQVGPSGALPNAANTAVEAYAQLAMLSHYANDVEGMIACSVLAGREAQRAAPAREVAALHGSLAHTASFFQLMGAMRRHVQAAQLVAERVGTPLVVGTAFQFTGHLAACQGEFDVFQTDMRRAHAAYAELGRCRPLEEALTNLAFLAIHRGEPTRAIELATELEASGRARDDAQSASWGLMLQGLAHLVQGRCDESLSLLDLAEPMLADKLTEIGVGAARALALLRSGQHEQALVVAMRTLDLIERAPSTSFVTLLAYGFEMDALLGLVRQAPQAADRAQAQAGCVRMVKAFRAYARLFPVARVQLIIWTGAVADVQGRSAAAEQAWRRALTLACTSQVPLDRPMARRWLAHACSGPERATLLNTAADEFDALGFRFEADEARRAAAGPDGCAAAAADERMAA